MGASKSRGGVSPRGLLVMRSMYLDSKDLGAADAACVSDVLYG